MHRSSSSGGLRRLAAGLTAAVLAVAAAPAARAADTVVLVLDAGDAGAPRTAAMEAGLLLGLGLEGADPGAASYAVDGYTLEVVADGDLAAQTRRDDVVAVVCRTSSVCAHALDEDAAADVLVVAVSATSNELAGTANVLRMAPSNRFQAVAIHREVASDLEGDADPRFAVVYEPGVYGMDLYSSLLAENVRGKFLEEAGTPDLVAAIPLMDQVPLQESQKSVTAAEALAALEGLGGLDAVVYLGGAEGFDALTDPVTGNPALAPRWYAADASYPVPASRAADFGALKAFGLSFPADGPSPYYQYYYGFDAGLFLRAVMANGGGTDRASFLAAARSTAVDEAAGALTGPKSFQQADESGRFTVQVLGGQDFEVSVP